MKWATVMVLVPDRLEFGTVAGALAEQANDSCSPRAVSILQNYFETGGYGIVAWCTKLNDGPTASKQGKLLLCQLHRLAVPGMWMLFVNTTVYILNNTPTVQIATSWLCYYHLVGTRIVFAGRSPRGGGLVIRILSDR